MASAVELSSGKTVLILSLVIGCFAILWPKIFYPMLQASIASTTGTSYSEVAGVYHASVLPCCHPVAFSKELNALYFTELCNRLKWRASRRPDLLPAEPRHDLWTPGLARWCRDELLRTCGVSLDESALERYRRAAHQPDEATRNLTRCLEASYDLRRDDIRPTRRHLRTATNYPHHDRPAVGLREGVPHAAAAAAHVQAQNMARMPRRNDRGARPGMRPTMGGGYGGFVQPQVKGSGAMGIIMPIYTIGIVVFFLYTILRVMFKKQPDKEPLWREPSDRGAAYGRHRDSAASVTRPEPAAVKTVAASAAAVSAAPPLPPPKPEEAEIDQLRRRLEDTERAMERIMKQMSTVSHRLNAAKISSNIRALKQPSAEEEEEVLEPTGDKNREELWGSVDSLASDSCATDYSLSLDSRAQVLTDGSLYTYSVDSPAPAPSRDDAVASAVSQLYRSVSQLSLELETAPADDDASLPAETGAELSEMVDGEEAGDVVDGVVELHHDGENATETSLASIEDDLEKAAQALKKVNQKQVKVSNWKDTNKVPSTPTPPTGGAAPTDASGEQRIQERHGS